MYQAHEESLMITSGHFVVKLAEHYSELEDTLKLRFEVFNRELNEGLSESYVTGLDRDIYDSYCDHLIVVDTRCNRVVGTYRLLLGFVAGTPAAYTGVLFYLVIYLAMNMGAFGLFTAFGLVGDHTTFEDLRGLGWKRPAMGVAAAIFMLSLAGIPPMGGFYGKYMIFKELVGTGHVGLAVLGVLASLVSAYYYLRFLVALFLQAPSAEAERLASDRPAVHAPLAGATVLVSAAIVLAGGFVQAFLVTGFAQRALQEGLSLLR